MSNRAIQILEDAGRAIREEMAAVESSIKSLEGKTPDSENPAVAILLQGRDRLQKQLQEVDGVITRIKAIRDGNVPRHGAAPEGGRSIVAGQWSRLALPQAFRAYASERGGGPFDVKAVLQDLKLAGVRVVMTRSRFQKNKEREMDLRDIRLLGSNNPVLYDYDREHDTLRLRSEKEAADMKKEMFKRDRKFKPHRATA